MDLFFNKKDKREKALITLELKFHKPENVTLALQYGIVAEIRDALMDFECLRNLNIKRKCLQILVKFCERAEGRSALIQSEMIQIMIKMVNKILTIVE